MAYTTIDDPSAHFTIALYTGTSDDSVKTVTNDANAGDFKPDWLWIKGRSGSYAARNHSLFDSSRGATKRLESSTNNAEATNSDNTFNTNGFSLSADYAINGLNTNHVAWQWKAGGTTPTKTYKVVVVSDSGNKYRFRNSADTATYAASAVTLDLQEGGTYTFDQSDSSNSGHPLRFSTTSNGSHGGGSEYTTGVTTSGTAGNAGAFTQITVAASAPTLYYYCTNHSAMGGQVNTNTTHGQTNFDGSILSVTQTNTEAGFNIVTYTGTGSNATVGHGLGVVPKLVIYKRRSAVENWGAYHPSTGNTGCCFLNLNIAKSTASSYFNNTSPTSTTLGVGDSPAFNGNGSTYVAYCFAEKQGYSKIGSYIGNGSTNGTFTYTGFKPAYIILKRTDASADWHTYDNKREPNNPLSLTIFPSGSSGEANGDALDFLSNGFKQRNSGAEQNASGGTYIYMAFAESPLVSSEGVPTTAR